MIRGLQKRLFTALVKRSWVEVLVLIAGLPGKSRVTLALVWPDTFTMFALWLAHRLTLSPGPAGPAPAAVNPPTVTTQANG